MSEDSPGDGATERDRTGQAGQTGQGVPAGQDARAGQGAEAGQDAPAPRKARTRMSPAERRRQLLGIGLRKLVERPIQELSIDEVAQEAGISRGLLFHYFPTKTAYYDEVVAAAGRRVMRNTAPDGGLAPGEALPQSVSRLYAQIERRREFYLALVFGRGAHALGGERVDSLRAGIARRTLDILGLDEAALPVAHAWAAYAEDRALQWSARPQAEREATQEAEVDHCVRALHALLALV